MYKNYAFKSAVENMHRFIERLYAMFITCRNTNDTITSSKDSLEQLEQANEEYVPLLHDRREIMRMKWRIAIIFLSAGVDYLLSSNAMPIIVEKFSMPLILSYAVPFFLIGIEIAISYFQSLRQRSASEESFFLNHLQYVVLIVLVSLTVLVVMFSLQSYNQTLDGPFIPYLIGTVAFQVALLAASIMLHLFLIREAEQIMEAIAFMRFKREHDTLSKQLSRLRDHNGHNNLPAFTKDSQKFVQELDSFNRQFPDANIDFTKTMPADLLRAVNLAMGRKVFVIESHSED